MVSEQRAVVAMSARTDLELAASAEEGQLNCRNVPFHVDPQAAF
jgi:autonomous glycyl radical cofactor GrcA